MTDYLPLTTLQRGALLSFAFFVVAFGQPLWSEGLSLFSAFCGFACFWRVLLSIPKAKNRFYLGMVWFGAIQVVQLSWFTSHPFLYIYGILLFCALLMGLQWGILAVLINPRIFNRISSLLALAGLWTLLEWSRLFILSGLPFNPVGLTLSGSVFSMQFASLGGVFLLSFWVILTNLLLLRAWIQPISWLKWACAGYAFALPFIFGWAQLEMDQKGKDSPKASVLLVQTALPIEENLKFQSAEEARQFVLDEWRQILSTMQTHSGKKIDLIVLPEYIVPYGTFHHIFPLASVQQLFTDLFGDHAVDFLSDQSPYMDYFQTDQGVQPLVSNAYFAQSLADLFQAHVVIGFEDSLYEKGGKKKAESYSSAFHFIPGGIQKPARYEKRVLVPMGEYIPFQWCRELAAQYGVTGSFTCGTRPTVFQGPVPLGVSICYEEIYGNIIRESRLQGAEMLVNLTNDGWFPNSRLPKQHFDHARLRTVENGIPLVRACNTGVTGAIDSLGRIVGVFGDDHMAMQEEAGSILLDVPLYHYSTLYSQFGNFPILALSAFFLFFLRKKSQ